MGKKKIGAKTAAFGASLFVKPNFKRKGRKGKVGLVVARKPTAVFTKRTEMQNIISSVGNQCGKLVQDAIKNYGLRYNEETDKNNPEAVKTKAKVRRLLFAYCTQKAFNKASADNTANVITKLMPNINITDLASKIDPTKVTNIPTRKILSAAERAKRSAEKYKEKTGS
jgi:hypothetical protein